MKKLLLCGLLSMNLMLAADELERAPVGSRAMPTEEVDSHQHERALREEEAMKKSASTLARGVKMEYSSHMGAFHHPVMISPLGDMVELEDGSRWAVSHNHRLKTYNWLTSDTLKITPHNAWFSNYQFQITNINTSETVDVNVIDRPIYNGIYTYWIIAIDYVGQQICLNDGSVWNLSSFDYNVFSKWIINDTIILGHNKGYFVSSRPNILINCETASYVESRCLN